MIDPLLFIGLIFLPMGILFLVLGIVIYNIFKKRQNRASATTTATVVEIVRERSRRSNSTTMTTYHPVYEYYANGEFQRVKSVVGASPCPYRIGEQVELHFNPDKPLEIFVEGDSRTLWIVRAVFCGVGGLFAILGAAFLYVVFV